MSVIRVPQRHTVKMMTGFLFFAELHIKELFTNNWPGIGFDGFRGAYFGWRSYRGREGWFRSSRGARCGGGGSLRQAGGCNGYSFTAWALASLCSTILTAWLLTTCFLQYIYTKKINICNSSCKLTWPNSDALHFKLVGLQVSVKELTGFGAGLGFCCRAFLALAAAAWAWCIRSDQERWFSIYLLFFNN